MWPERRYFAGAAAPTAVVQPQARVERRTGETAAVPAEIMQPRFASSAARLSWI
jgi:hypothetical protein